MMTRQKAKQSDLIFIHLTTILYTELQVTALPSRTSVPIFFFADASDVTDYFDANISDI